MDLICLPYWKREFTKLTDLPERYQAEDSNAYRAAIPKLVGGGLSKMGEKKRGMIFFQWYGKILESSVDIPITISPINISARLAFRSSTKSNPLTAIRPTRVTFRVLYNINNRRPQCLRQGRRRRSPLEDESLFIFDDTLQHGSHNESDGLRYCLFVISPAAFVPWH